PVGRLRRETFLDGQRLASEQRGPLRQLAGEILLPRLDLAPQLVPPRRDPVRPGLDPPAPPPRPVDVEPPGPAVVSERPQRLLRPARRARRLEADGGVDHVVPVL